MEGSWLTELQTISPTLKVGTNESSKSGRTFLLALLDTSEAAPPSDDGWFASDFALVHLIYGECVDVQCWLTRVDLLEEAKAWGPYLWGHPKQDRTMVFSKDDSKFYSLCSPEALIAEFKGKLQEMISSMEIEDKLLLLIFAHGENVGSSGILVGVDGNGDFGILTALEVNELLQPLLGCQPVTLITSACYSRVWHDGMPIGTRVAASSRLEESLSFPTSASGSCRGGYFWGGIWYEFSRLGFWVSGDEIVEDETFRRWSEKVKQRVQDMFLFHPVPTTSVPTEDIWDKHAREVLCYKLEGEYMSLTKVPANSPRLVQYFCTCNPGLPNAASNIQVFRLVRCYKKGWASKEQLGELGLLLGYRVLEDERTERILSFLRIPRVSSIAKFKQWKTGSEISPFLLAVSSIMPFANPPKMTPQAYRYTKPPVFVAWTAFMAKVDLEWFKTNLSLYVDSHRASSSAGKTSGAGETSGD